VCEESGKMRDPALLNFIKKLPPLYSPTHHGGGGGGGPGGREALIFPPGEELSALRVGGARHGREATHRPDSSVLSSPTHHDGGGGGSPGGRHALIVHGREPTHRPDSSGRASAPPDAAQQRRRPRTQVGGVGWCADLTEKKVLEHFQCDERRLTIAYSQVPFEFRREYTMVHGAPNIWSLPDPCIPAGEISQSPMLDRRYFRRNGRLPAPVDLLLFKAHRLCVSLNSRLGGAAAGFSGCV